MEGGGELFSGVPRGVPRSVRGESAENKASTLDFPCLSRRWLQRTPPTNDLGFFGSRAWLGLGVELGGLMRGCGSIDPGSGDFVPSGGVLWLSDWAGVGSVGSAAGVAGSCGATGPCDRLSIISAQ
jgi:hypothetical protein